MKFPTTLISLVMLLACFAPYQLTHAVTANPRDTPMPDFTGCSSTQRDYLKDAWRRAHEYAWRADRMLQFIKKQNEQERRYLWNLDYQPEVRESTSPRTFFGPWNRERFQNIEDAVQKAVRRFEKRGKALKGIKKIRCGQPIAPKANEHIDVCPKKGTGGGQIGAYHAVAGYLVTCPAFWENANNPETNLSYDERLHNSARTLVHEIFHWLSVDGKYITDSHGGQYRKGAGNVSLLAREHYSWAIRNNDNYAWFIANVGLAQPSFSAVWLEKPNPNIGTGAFYVNRSWDDLVAIRNRLINDQYLTSVTTYVKDGKRLYSGIWRRGSGAGALYTDMDWNQLANNFNAFKATQHLINIDAYKVGNNFHYIGVWRHKRNGEQGVGGLRKFENWDQLKDWWKSFGNNAHLRDVETFVSNGKRYFVAVALPSKGNGSLYWTKDRDGFENLQKRLEGSEILIDFERFLDGGGNWNYLGVWKKGNRWSGLSLNRPLDFLLERRNELKSENLLLNLDYYGPLATRIP